MNLHILKEKTIGGKCWVIRKGFCQHWVYCIFYNRQVAVYIRYIILHFPFHNGTGFYSPAFIAAFMQSSQITADEAEEIRKMIDRTEE